MNIIKSLYRSFRTSSHYQSLNTISINANNILHNFHILQDIQPWQTIIPVLKSNAYGHGLQQIATILNQLSHQHCPLLAIDSYPEYQILRDRTKKQILVLWETLPHNYRLYNPRRAHIAVGSLDVLHSLIATKKKRKIHLFLNTGMNREGFQKDSLWQALELLSQHHDITVIGVMSHLANADSLDTTFTEQQISRFKEWLKQIQSAWHNPQYSHISNSAGLVKINDPLFTASRSGLALYGYNPLQADGSYYSTYKNLKPALRLTTTITALQHLEPGDWVSYGLDRTTKKPTTLATLPLWYNEWLPRFSGDWYQVYKDNHPFPIRGKVCMNLCSIEIGKQKISIWDTIEVIWYDEEKTNMIEILAEINHTIPYTILTGLDKNIKRVIVD